MVRSVDARSVPNAFGVNDGRVGTEPSPMPRETTILEATDAPSDRPTETLDVADLGPPEPLRKTLELLGELSDETILVQRNDRVPQFLLPKLDDRGYAYDAVETDDGVVTAIWAADAEATGDGERAAEADR